MSDSIRLRLLLGVLVMLGVIFGTVWVGEHNGLFGLAFGLAAIAALVLSVALAVSVARPVEELARTAGLIAAALPELRVRERGPREVAALARQVNRLARELEGVDRSQRDFIAAAAHELVTPLSGMRGIVQGLRDGSVPADDTVLEMLQRETEEMLRLSQSLLALADAQTRRSVAAPRQAVPLSETVSSVLAELREDFGRRSVEVMAEVPPDVHLMANPEHLRRILTNLLYNAARYSSAGGRTWISAEPGFEMVTVSVTSTGDEIPKDDVPHLYDRFFRVDRSRERGTGGAGIGLAVVKQLVLQGGGTVGAQSLGGRNRFWFTLPSAMDMELS